MQTNRSPSKQSRALTAKPPDETLDVNVSNVFTTVEGETRAGARTQLLDLRACVCGAQLDDGQTICRKCRARERWHRRHQLRRDNQRRTDAHRTAMLLLGPGPR